MASVSWTSPQTNRLLLEARGGFRGENYKYNGIAADDPPEAADHGHRTGLGQRRAGRPPIPRRRHRRRDRDPAVSEHLRPQLSTSCSRRRTSPGRTRPSSASATRSCCSNESLDDNIYHVSYRFNNGIPNQITQRTTPYKKAQRQPAGIGLYAQDRWTLNRLTLNMGLRYDYLKITIPAQHLDPAPLVPEPEPRPARDRSDQLEGHHAASGGRLRSVRRRQDRAQDQRRQVRDRAGRAGALRRRDLAGQPAGEFRHRAPGPTRPSRSAIRAAATSSRTATSPTRWPTANAATCRTPTSAARRRARRSIRAC